MSMWERGVSRGGELDVKHADDGGFTVRCFGGQEKERDGYQTIEGYQP